MCGRPLENDGGSEAVVRLRCLPQSVNREPRLSFAPVFFRILAHSAAVGGVAFSHLRYDSWRCRIASVVVAVVVVAVIVVVVIVVIVVAVVACSSSSSIVVVAVVVV